MIAEDFSIFTDPTLLGDSATVGTGTINGIFSREFAEVNRVEGYYPAFLVSDTDAATITKKVTTLTIKAVNYKSVSHRQDGTGMTLLILEKS